MKHLILGAGNMINSLLPQYIQNSSDSFAIYTPSEVKAKKFAETYGIDFIKKIESLSSYNVLWIGMKPQSVDAVAVELKDKLKLDTLVISMLAGVSIDQLQKKFNTNQVIRIMPNLSAQVKLGVNLLCCSTQVKDSFFQQFLKDFEGSGKNYIFPSEEMIDILTPFSGSGPAYFFEIARIYVEEMIQFGVPEETAREIMALVMQGSGQLILNSKENLETLRENVTSKNGVTFAALEVLKENNFKEIISKSIDRAYHKVLELKKG